MMERSNATVLTKAAIMSEAESYVEALLTEAKLSMMTCVEACLQRRAWKSESPNAAVHATTDSQVLDAQVRSCVLEQVNACKAHLDTVISAIKERTRYFAHGTDVTDVTQAGLQIDALTSAHHVVPVRTSTRSLSRLSDCTFRDDVLVLLGCRDLGVLGVSSRSLLSTITAACEVWRTRLTGHSPSMASLSKACKCEYALKSAVEAERLRRLADLRLCIDIVQKQGGRHSPVFSTVCRFSEVPSIAQAGSKVTITEGANLIVGKLLVEMRVPHAALPAACVRVPIPDSCWRVYYVGI